MTALVKDCSGVDAGFLMVPADGHDPYFPDSRNPSALLLQLEFRDICALERALSVKGCLEPLADQALWPSLAGCSISHQAMMTRRYTVPDATIRSEDGSSLSYMVEYQGPAEDANAWHVSYMARHPLLLAKFPGIRAIEIYTPLSVVTGLPFRDRGAMQRNKTVFDSTEAMNTAMACPARDELRADALKLPPFSGAKDHFPFRADMIRGGPAR
ncbi:hypothetical protein NKI31_12185 [Mesorhizobium sp. M0659]|uniref:hypothetical protein n=1 Tax=Mesorhizobium sp. M0659 TaxID=2956980 RepID=UPI003338903D